MPKKSSNRRDFAPLESSFKAKTKNLPMADDLLDGEDEGEDKKATEREINSAIFASFYTGKMQTTVDALRAAGFEISERIMNDVAIKRTLSELAEHSDNEASRLKALELLGKTQALFVDRVDHSANSWMSFYEMIHKKATK